MKKEKCLKVSMLRKIVSVVLTMCMIVGFGTSTYASEIGVDDYNLSIKEREGICVSVTSDSTSQYIAVYDKKQNTMQVSIKNIETGKVDEGKIVEVNKDVILRASKSKIHQDTFSDYEYDVYTGSTNEWRCERPNGNGQGYFKTYENGSNTTQLNQYFTDVNNLNDKEWTAVISCGVSVVAAAGAGFASGIAVASGGTLTPAAIAAIVGATGATGAAEIALIAVGTQCNVCELSYWNALRACDNTHY